MEQKIQVRIPNKDGSAEVHSFIDLDNARDYLTKRIRQEAKDAKAKSAEPKEK